MATSNPYDHFNHQDAEGFLGNFMQTDSAGRFGDAPTGFGSQYDALFAANPYRKQTYNQSLWQKFLGSLGFRTGYDDWLDQTSTQIAEYDAGIYSMIQQNEYNSPAAQAERMRAAGQNPDLLGTGDVAGAASPAEDVNGMNVAPTNEFDPMSMVTSFAQSGFKLVTSVMGIMKDMKALKNMDLVNEGAEITNGNNVMDLIYQTILKTSSPDQRPDPTKLSGALDIAMAGLFPDEKQRKRYGDLALQVFQGLPVDAENWKTWYERAQNKVGYARVAGSANYDEGVGDLMMTYYGALTDLSTELEKLHAKWQTDEWNEEITRLASHDAKLEGETQNEQYQADIAVARYSKQQAEMAETLNSTFKAWTDSLQKYSDEGKVWAKIGLALVGTLRLIALNGLSYSQNSSSFVGKNGTGSSSGFSFGF